MQQRSGRLFGLRQLSLIAASLLMVISAPWTLVPAGTVCAATFIVTPSEIVLEGRFARTQVLVAAQAEGLAAERATDLTMSATYASSDVAVFQVDDRGVIAPRADGEATLYEQFQVPAGPHRLTIRMRDSSRSEGFDYQLDQQVHIKEMQNLVIGFDPGSKQFVIH